VAGRLVNAAGDQQISTRPTANNPRGGEVFIPANQPQTPPPGGGTGIYSQGVEQARNPKAGQPGELAFVPVSGPALATNNPFDPTYQAPAAMRPALDNEEQKKIVAQYPEIGQAGSWAHANFMAGLKPGVNTGAQAQEALNTLIKAPTPPAADPLPTPTLARTAPAVIPNAGAPKPLPASTLDAQAPTIPTFGLATGAATPAANLNPLIKPAAPLVSTSIGVRDIAEPNPSLVARASQAVGGIAWGGSQDISTDPTKQPRVGWNSGKSLVAPPPAFAPVSPVEPPKIPAFNQPQPAQAPAAQESEEEKRRKLAGGGL
jgi:hypothetical protein